MIFNLKAQDVWVDCVMGKPYMAHFDAMKAVAKEWGINYKVEFMGCVLSKKMMAVEKKQDKLNAQYFEKLAARFGEDWQKRFKLAVQKQKPIYSSEENPVWKNTILGRPYMAYLDAKKEIAKEWGINYEPVFLGCVIDKPGIKEQNTAAEKVSKPYLAAIAAHYGEDWKEIFEAEAKKRLAENTATNDKD